MKILVTGGTGFIGCNFVKHAVAKNCEVTVLDKITYAGKMENLADVSRKIRFVKGDITDKKCSKQAMQDVDAVVNFAAETHVDRSIQDASPFVNTNILGIFNLLECARKEGVEKFIQISTDEVYGSLKTGKFVETDALHPRNPYSATKAAGENLVVAYANTYGMQTMITRSSNNYGPYQYPEKFIPKAITNAISGIKIPVYGKGTNIRDWIFVEDNCSGIFTVLQKGVAGEVYNIGGGNEKSNIEVVKMILKNVGKPESLISFVDDRPGHDFRYALDSHKLMKLGWKPAKTFEQGIKATIEWYSKNAWWWRGR